MRSIRTLWMFALVGSAAALGASGWVHARDTARERTQMERLERVTMLAARAAQLEAELPAWALSARPSGTLAPQVSAAVAAAGLPASALASLSPETDGGASGKGAEPLVRRRRATLVLAPVTLGQLGKFLQAWRERQPAWIVSGIDVSPEVGAGERREGKGGQAGVPPGGDLPLRAVVVVEAMWLERGGVR